MTASKAQFSTAQQASFKPTWPAELYSLARPDYPREAIDAILKATNATKPLNYVDLAAGTGIFTQLLIQACTNSPENQYRLSNVAIVEPDDSMRAQLVKTVFNKNFVEWKEKGLLDQDVKAHATSGLFDTVDLSQFDLQGKIDLLTIAQAWHWCETWDKSLEQISKVLKPGGVLAILWNLEDRETAHWVAQIRDVYESFEGNSRQYRHDTWKSMYDTRSMKELFEILPEKHISRNLPTTVEGVVNRVLSKSYVSMQTPQVQKEVQKKVEEIFATNNDEVLQRRWIDEKAGTFEYPYITDVLLFRKK